MDKRLITLLRDATLGSQSLAAGVSVEVTEDQELDLIGQGALDELESVVGDDGVVQKRPRGRPRKVDVA